MSLQLLGLWDKNGLDYEVKEGNFEKKIYHLIFLRNYRLAEVRLGPGARVPHHLTWRPPCGDGVGGWLYLSREEMIDHLSQYQSLDGALAA